MTDSIAELAYLIASLLFILGLRGLRAPQSARRGLVLAEAGMLIAIVATLLHHRLVRYEWIGAGVVIGSGIGTAMAVLIPMTKMPERIALSHAFGGLAAALVGVSEYYRHGGLLASGKMAAVGFEVMLGAVSFTGSLIAFGKLQGMIAERPLTHRFQNTLNISLSLATLAMIGYLIAHAAGPLLFYIVVGLSFLLGILLVLPIGGADMPVVISLLNSYAGLSAAAMGFVLDSRLLIIAGALDGSSGFILSVIMSKAMNRSFTNVLFGAFGQVQQAKAGGEAKVYKSETIEGAAQVLEQANLVVIIPGYGMAVAQAQHKVRELYDQLKKRGITVKFAIHPVAGRMPGHMNVLLAEADIPYTDLVEMDEINPDMPQCDVALVVGANDVVNPAARTEKTSPIYGMPIIDADRARTVFAIKRSKNPGFAGIDNELYFSDKTWMLFGDAKSVIGELVKQLSGGSGMH